MRILTRILLLILGLAGFQAHAALPIGPGNAVRFDGVDDFIEFSVSSLLNVPQWTVNAWILPEVATANHVIVSKTSPGVKTGWSLIQDGTVFTGNLWLLRGGSNYLLRASTASGALSVGSWNHVGAQFSSNSVRLFINGTQVAIQALPEPSLSIPVNPLPVRVGSHSTGGSAVSGAYQGIIDELTFFNVALTGPALQDLVHNHPIGTLASNLVAWFPFDEGLGTSISTAGSPNSLTGALKNGPSWVLPANTPLGPPVVSTLEVTNIAARSATLRGEADARGRASVVWFEWGLDGKISDRTAAMPLGAMPYGTAAISTPLTGLLSHRSYTYRIALSNSYGVFYGAERKFGTLYDAPDEITLTALSESPTNATLNVSFNLHDQAGGWVLEWGNQPDAPWGRLAGSASKPVGTTNVSVRVDGLRQLTNYFARFSVTNAGGTATSLTWFTTRHFRPMRVEAPSEIGRLLTYAVGDFNGDGAQDLVLAALGENQNYDFFTPGSTPYWVRQSDSGIVWERASLDSFHADPTLLVADVDQDGDLDLIEIGVSRIVSLDITGSFGEENLAFGAWFWRNEGGQLRQMSIGGFESVGKPDVLLGDFDGDGRPDLLAYYYLEAQDAEPRVVFWKGRGDGQFIRIEGTAGLTSASLGHVIVGDLNRDGQPDLVSLTGETLVVYTNNLGVFSLCASLTVTNGSPGHPAVADITQDGILDLLIPVSDGLKVGLQAWTPSLQSSSTGLADSAMQNSTAPIGVDLNGDGLPDLVCSLPGTSDSPGLSLYINQGDGHYSGLRENFGSPSFVDDTFSMDFDGDGRSDIVTLAAFDLQIWRNEIGGAISPPRAPVGLRVQKQGDGRYRFQWDAVVDAAGRAGMTYAFRAAASAEDAGKFAGPTPTLGPISGTQFVCDASNLPPGEVYWSVQAVDAGFRRSAPSAVSRLDREGPPALHESVAENAVGRRAELTANVNALLVPTSVWFEWGPDASLKSSTPVQILGKGGVQRVVAGIEGLNAGIPYSFRTVASNALGLVYGPTQRFTTAAVTGIPGDTNGDGIVDLAELNAVILNYRKQTP